MEILFKGQTVIIENNIEDQENSYNLMCICGHKLLEHASSIFWYYPSYHHTIYTSQCTHLTDDNKFHCEQFRIQE